jgi:hypothetical protein
MTANNVKMRVELILNMMYNSNIPWTMDRVQHIGIMDILL